MALYILQPGCQPLGQFDFDNTDLPNIVGGELGTFDVASRSNTASETATADVLDGYVAQGAGTPTRPVLRLADSSPENQKLFFLLDDGKLGYGTLFGQVIGTSAGLVTSSTNLGPHTASASGKVTAWDKPGLYAVSRDAVAADLADFDTPVPGALLYRGATTGKLSSVGTDKVAQFIEFSNSGSLVRTPSYLVGSAAVYDRIVINYLGSSHSA